MSVLTPHEMPQMDKLDEIALNGGIVYELNGGYTVKQNLETINKLSSEYEFGYFGSRGCGNLGTMFLRGKTPRTKRLLRMGKLALLEREHALTNSQAEKLYDAIKCVKYGYEQAVITAVLTAMKEDWMPAFKYFPYGEVWRIKAWKRDFGTPKSFEGLSVPRQNSVAEIIRNLDFNI